MLIVDRGDAAGPCILATLADAGYRIDTLSVGDRQALQDALEARTWDLVFAACESSAGTARGDLHLVRHYARSAPFYLLSAHPGSVEEELALAVGADGVVDTGRLDLLPEVVLDGLLRAGERPGGTRRQAAVPADAVPAARGANRFRLLAESFPECMWIHDLHTAGVDFVNAAWEALWGESAAALRSDPDCWLQRVFVEDLPRMQVALERAPFGGVDDEVRIVRADGSMRWIHLRSFALRDDDGLIGGVAFLASDITSSVEQRSHMESLEHFDRLTTLPNRFLFQERLGAALALSRRNDWRLALMFIDLDRFKVVNDTLGHRAGDDLLRLVSERLKACLRDSDMVCRLGGDEFGVMLPDLVETDRAAIVARKIAAAIEQPFQMGGEEIFVSASIGITLFPEDAEDIESLVRNADTAMYRAKESGRGGYQFYTAEMNRRARQRLSLGNDLRRALARNQFELFYQPKLSCSSGAIVGVEALLRWRNPDRGLVSPGDFVPMLEETGLIVEVGGWVLGEACRQTRAWHVAGLGTPSVAVNVSGLQLENAGFPKVVAAALAESGLEARFLELELTETVLMRDAAAVTSILGSLKAMGVSLSVDDFGTGYSSLAYLKRFPLDCLKVDRSFVQDITADPDDASITRAIINMAHELALDVVAEGVETVGQLEMLLGGRCDQIQGFYFSPPVPAAEIEAMLRAGRGLDPLDIAGAQTGSVSDSRCRAPRCRTRDALMLECDELRARWNSGLGLMEEILESVATPLLGIADDGLIAFVNQAAERILAHYLPLVGLEAGRALPEVLQPLLATGDVVEAEVVLSRQRVRVRGWPMGLRSAALGQILVFEGLGKLEDGE